MNERADVVVIGGGVMGAAALRYLAELGCKRPVLLERETLASGSTSRLHRAMLKWADTEEQSGDELAQVRPPKGAVTRLAMPCARNSRSRFPDV